MTAGGWIFMLTSVGFVLGLVGFCFYRVLTGAGTRRPEDELARRAAPDASRASRLSAPSSAYPTRLGERHEEHRHLL